MHAAAHYGEHMIVAIVLDALDLARPLLPGTADSDEGGVDTGKVNRVHNEGSFVPDSWENISF